MKKLLRKYIPARYWYTLSNLRNSFGGYGHTYYSQFGEDIVLGKIFNGKNTGRYVDIGSHHPKRYSNTYLLYKRGWRGTNVDPNPHTKKLFDRARPDDRNVQCGVGNAGEGTYYQFSDPAVNTFSKEEAEHWMHKPWLEFLGTTEVQIRPLTDFMESNVDLLTIDVEGMDLEILHTNDWTKCSPKVIAIEDNEFAHTPMQTQVYKYLTQLGYHFAAYVGPTLIVMREK